MTHQNSLLSISILPSCPPSYTTDKVSQFQWTSIAVRYRGSTLTLYQDGTKASYTLPDFEVDDMEFAQCSLGHAMYLADLTNKNSNMDLDGFAVFDSPLEEAEVGRVSRSFFALCEHSSIRS